MPLLHSEGNLSGLANTTTARNNLDVGMSYTVATLPVSGYPGQTIFVSDAISIAGIGGVAVWNGTEWRMVHSNVVPTTSQLTFFRELSRMGINWRTNRMTYVFADFSSAFGELTTGATGTGSAIFTATNNVSGVRNGTLILGTGTTTTGTANSFMAPFVFLADGVFYLGAKVFLDTLSTATDEFAVRVGATAGYSNGGGNANFTSAGIGFIYDRANATGSLSGASNNWNIRNFQSAATISDSGVAVATGTAYALELVASATGVDYYINGTQVGSTVATNVPTNVLQPHITILKSAGTASRVFRVDFAAGGMYYSSSLDRYAV